MGPTKKKKNKDAGFKENKNKSPTAKKGSGQGRGGGRKKGSKLTKSPGGTSKVCHPPPGYTKCATSKKRLYEGAEVTPSSEATAASGSANSALCAEVCEVKGKVRKLIKKNEVLEKAAVTYITQLQELVRARNGEFSMVMGMLKGTQFNDFQPYRVPDAPEPQWVTETKAKIAASDSAALRAGAVRLDDLEDEFE